MDRDKPSPRSEEVTPVDSPSTAIYRLARHQRELCEAFDRVAPLLEKAARSDRVFVFEKLIDVCYEGEESFADCRKALIEMLDLELTMRPSKTPLKNGR